LTSAGWDKGPLSVVLTARGISAGVYNTSYIQCSSGCPASTANNMTISNNHLPGALYFDTSVAYDLPRQATVFLTIDNIANTAPAQVAYGPSIGGAPLSVNGALYDTLGRVFHMGVRFKM
jgi:outer membrane receptor protein involved in Fe transport